MPTSKRPKAKLVSSTDADVSSELLDAEIAEDLAERQDLDLAGRDNLGQRQRAHAAASPKLAGGDVDAAWDDETGDGEELVGGDTPTPDQDRVDDIGEGAGLTYKDDEPLNFAKVLARDQHRWELNAASAEPDEEEALELDDEDEDDEEDDDLDVLGLLDGEAEALEVVDVDDLAEEADEAEEVDEADLDDLDELEDDDSLIPDDDDDEDDDEDDVDDDEDEDDDF